MLIDVARCGAAPLIVRHMRRKWRRLKDFGRGSLDHLVVIMRSRGRSLVIRITDITRTTQYATLKRSIENWRVELDLMLHCMDLTHRALIDNCNLSIFSLFLSIAR